MRRCTGRSSRRRRRPWRRGTLSRALRDHGSLCCGAHGLTGPANCVWGTGPAQPGYAGVMTTRPLSGDPANVSQGSSSGRALLVLGPAPRTGRSYGRPTDETPPARPRSSSRAAPVPAGPDSRCRRRRRGRRRSPASTCPPSRRRRPQRIQPLDLQLGQQLPPTTACTRSRSPSCANNRNARPATASRCVEPGTRTASTSRTRSGSRSYAADRQALMISNSSASDNGRRSTG
jgi:hypothetical protein